MSRHWKPDGNVVRGDFRRRASAASTGWLSPEAYNALSPAEKRALQFRRAAQRPSRRRSSRPRYRKGRYARQQLWVFGVLVLGAIVSRTDLSLPSFPTSAPSSTPVTASFGYCHTGGGTNCVVDGDTFYLGGEKVRIAGIDAPETHPPRCADEARLGNQATEKLNALLNSGAVTMTSIDRDRDTYGRLLRNVAVNGQDVGEAMISAGVAREYGSGRRSWCG
jgi:endonuclease YncB( thermonuclease family)